jgi:hypothetical protein
MHRLFLGLALLLSCQTKPAETTIGHLTPSSVPEPPIKQSPLEAKTIPVVNLALASTSRTAPGGLSDFESPGMPPLPLSLFSFVIGDEEGYRMVLREEIKPQWAVSSPRLVSSDEPFIVQRDVDISTLPPELAAWQYQPVRLFGVFGQICETTVVDFSLIGRLGHDWFEEKVSPTNLAADIWAQSVENGQQFLVADLEIDEEDCPGASWARLAMLPVPEISEAFPITGDFAIEAIKAFRQLPAYEAVQLEYEAMLTDLGDAPGRSRWDEVDGSYPDVWVMSTNLGLSLVWVSAEMNLYDCIGHMFRLEAAFTTGSDRAHPHFAFLGILDKDAPIFLEPYAAVNLDGGGTWEFIGEGELLHKMGTLYQSWAYLEDPTIPPGYYCF